jgi:dTDP-glucose pyrophosphorylase
MSFEYKVQEVPNGLAQAFVIGADFVGSDSVCLILGGNNIFYGADLSGRLNACTEPNGAIITAYPVHDPSATALCSLMRTSRQSASKKSLSSQVSLRSAWPLLL